MSTTAVFRKGRCTNECFRSKPAVINSSIQAPHKPDVCYIARSSARLRIAVWIRPLEYLRCAHFHQAEVSGLSHLPAELSRQFGTSRRRVFAITAASPVGRFGRRKMLLITFGIFIAGALVSLSLGPSRYSSWNVLWWESESALASSVVLYIARYLQPRARGWQVSLFQWLAITIRILVPTWRITYSPHPAVAMDAGSCPWFRACARSGMLFFLKKPRAFLPVMATFDLARTVLIKIRTQDVGRGISGDQTARSKGTTRTRLRLTAARAQASLNDWYRPSIFQQVTGSNTTHPITRPTIIIRRESPRFKARYCHCGHRNRDVVMTLVSMWLSIASGRRPLLADR